MPIGAGETVVIANVEGPGKIVHIWCTVSHADPFYASKLTLRKPLPAWRPRLVEGSGNGYLRAACAY